MNAPGVEWGIDRVAPRGRGEGSSPLKKGGKLSRRGAPQKAGGLGGGETGDVTSPQLKT